MAAPVMAAPVVVPVVFCAWLALAVGSDLRCARCGQKIAPLARSLVAPPLSSGPASYSYAFPLAGENVHLTVLTNPQHREFEVAHASPFGQSWRLR